jgi:hypothetical protein
VRLPACLSVILMLFAPLARALDVYAAGDVAQCPGAAADSGAARTARLIPDDATVLVLGDSTYPFADTATIKACYDPTWGRFRAHTFAAPGNHDYAHGSAHDFLAYFGERTPGHTWFRAALGDWWVIGLDSNIGSDALAEQERWLESELRTIAGDGRCIVAIWHHALFSSGLHKGDGAPMKPAWRALDAAGADLVLSGHEHFYESFGPRDAEGNEQAGGIREFVVGTGGARLSDFSLSSQHRDYARSYGVLELKLERNRYEFGFKTVDGEVRDRGSATCRRPALAAAAR